MSMAGAFIRIPVTQVVEGDVLAANADKPTVKKVDVFEDVALVFVQEFERPIIYDSEMSTFVTRGKAVAT